MICTISPPPIKTPILFVHLLSIAYIGIICYSSTMSVIAANSGANLRIQNPSKYHYVHLPDRYYFLPNAYIVQVDEWNFRIHNDHDTPIYITDDEGVLSGFLFASPEARLPVREKFEFDFVELFVKKEIGIGYFHMPKIFR